MRIQIENKDGVITVSDRNNCCENNLKETVCIDVNRIYDQCRDRDCVQDARVYLCPRDQELINSAQSVKPISAEIVYAYPDIEPLQFNRGFYTVDIRFFVYVTVDVYTGLTHPTRVSGISVYDKKVILYGSEGAAKIFSSEYVKKNPDLVLPPKTNTPVATVETLDPILLSAKVVPICEPCGCCICDICSIPNGINERIGGLCDPDKGNALYVTYGFFTVIRMMRRVQMIVHGYDFCVPDKECCTPTEEDPCGFFNRMEFPIDEFCPPRSPDSGICC